MSDNEISLLRQQIEQLEAELALHRQMPSVEALLFAESALPQALLTPDGIVQYNPAWARLFPLRFTNLDALLADSPQNGESPNVVFLSHLSKADAHGSHLFRFIVRTPDSRLFHPSALLDRLPGQSKLYRLTILMPGETAYDDFGSQPTTANPEVESPFWFRELIEEISEGLAVYHGSELVYVNTVLSAILGYSHEELRNMTALDYALPHERERLLAAREAFFRDPSQNTVDFWIQTKSGQRKYIRNTYSDMNRRGYRLVLVTDLTEAKEREMALQNYASDLEFALKSANAGHWDWNMFTSRLSLSSEWARQIGLASNTLLLEGNNWGRFIHPADQKRFRDAIRQHLDNQTPFYEIEYRQKFGDSYRWVQSRGKLVEADRSNELYHFAGIDIDISHKKETQAELEQTQEMYRLLAENSTDMIARHSPDGLFTYVSPSCLSILGYRPDEMTGTNPYDYFHPDDLPGVARSHQYVLIEKVPNTIRFRMRRKDGSYVWLESTIRAIFGSDGNALEIHAASRDISERIAAEMALKSSEYRFRSLVQNLPIIFFSIDRNGLFTLSEGLGLRALNLSSGEVVGSSVFDIYAAYPDVVQCIRKALTGIEIRAALSLPPYVFESWFLPLFDEQGQPDGIIGFSIDISERIRADQELRLSEEKYAKAFNSNALSIIITDIETGRIVEANQTFCRRIGQPPEAVLGKRGDELELGIDKQQQSEKLQGYVQKLLDTDYNVSDYEILYRFPDNTFTSELVSSSRITVGDKNYLITTAADITAQRKAEFELHQSRETLDRIFNTLADVIVLLDVAPEGEFVVNQYNRAFVDLLLRVSNESAVSDVVGIELGSLLSRYLNLEPSDIMYLTQFLEQTTTQREMQAFEQQYTLRLGTVFVEMYATPVFEGTICRQVLWTVHDITGLKHTEKELSVSRKMLKTVIDTIPVRVFWKDTQSVYIGCNLPFALDAGLSLPEDIVGKTDFDLAFRNQAELYRADDAQVMQSGLPKLNYEEPQDAAHGSIWLKTSKIPLIDEQKQVFGVLGVYEDITERKRYEAELLTYRNQLEQLVAQRTEALEQANAELQAVNEELYNKNSELHLSNEQLEEEIQKRLATQLALEESEDKFRSFIEQSTEGILLADNTGRIVEWNTAMEAIFGLNKYHASTKYLWDIDAYLVSGDFTTPAATDAHRQSEISEGYFQTPEGDKYLIHISFPVITPLARYYGRIVRDVTGMKKAQEKIERQARELQTINTDLENQRRQLSEILDELHTTHSQLVQSEKMASLGVLMAGIAHEINNPVNYINASIEGFELAFRDFSTVVAAYDELFATRNEYAVPQPIVQLKAEIYYDQLRQEIPHMISNMKKGVRRITEIVKSLRTFARIDDDQPRPTDIHELLDTTLVMLYNQYKDHISLEKDYGAVPTIKAYPGKLSQVFMNLLSNAIHSIHGSGHIRIRTGVNDGQLVISIKDTGVGIEPAVATRIFEPFFTTKDVGKGTGLGLSISYDIIKKHQGDIRFESKPGKGSEFTITIPLNAS